LFRDADAGVNSVIPNLFQSSALDSSALELIESAKCLFAALEAMDDFQKIAAINEIKIALHHASPLRSEPVDCVLWVPSDDVRANDYNPNSVAPPEMALLERSIEADGYTQPIVTMLADDGREVIDGFHRNRVGKESVIVRNRVLGYLPVVTINESRTDRGDR